MTDPDPVDDPPDDPPGDSADDPDAAPSDPGDDQAGDAQAGDAQAGDAKTHAQASRQRRDLASGAVMEEARLVRYVAGPDDTVTPDLARRLPGRGFWVESTRTALATAVKRDAFSRAAKRRLTVPSDLGDVVEGLLRRRLLAGLGLARRAGELICGYEKTAAAIGGGRTAWWIEASDGSSDGRRKLQSLASRSRPSPELFAAFDSSELGLALGLENAIHAAFLAGRAAERWTSEVRRLNGFAPLFPESWREGR